MKHIIISKTYGVFIGTVSNYCIFSKSELAMTYKAYAFDSNSDAKKYINSNFKSKDKEDFFVADIETNDEYVSCVEIIKSGYADHVGNMMNFMPMISESIH